MVDEHSVERRKRALQRYDHYTEYPLFVLSLAFLVGLIMVVDDGSKSEYAQTGQLLMTLSWAAFLCDYVIRFTLSTDRLKFVTHNVIQGVAVLVPPLRILLVGKVFKTMTTGAKRRFAGRVRVYAVYLTTLTLVVAAVLVTMFERDAPGSNIHSLGDALWWTTETVSTVGYGDFYPVTVPGRIVAIALFINGIALLSAVTATISQKVLDYDDEAGEDSGVTLADLHHRMADIQAQIGQLATTSSGRPEGLGDNDGTADPGGTSSGPS